MIGELNTNVRVETTACNTLKITANQLINLLNEIDSSLRIPLDPRTIEFEDDVLVVTWEVKSTERR